MGNEDKFSAPVEKEGLEGLLSAGSHCGLLRAGKEMVQGGKDETSAYEVTC